jgi:amino acid adenylation domain-containing protein
MNGVLTLCEGTPSKTTAQPRRCIHELFEAQARRMPEAIAVTCGQEILTYRELDQRANHLANQLRTLGVGPEVPVALYLERSLNMVVAILGVLKAGGAYVPIDLAYPKDRAAFMLEDAKAPVLLTQEKLLESLPAIATTVICVDSEPAKTAAQFVEPPQNLATGDNAAYVIYTSGSTGKPKGVVVTHHNVVRLLQQTQHWYDFKCTDVWSLFHSYAFDVSVYELWGALCHGGRLVVVPYLVTRSPSDFYALLAKERVTVLSQTPSAFRQLIWAEASAATKLPLQLRYVICAGEALELQSLKPWFELHGDEKPLVVNMYGITETTVHSTFRIIRQADLTSGAGSVIGVPIPDLQIYLLDEDLKPVAKGVPGEICVGGAGVARGYLNRPELTSKRFVPDPFSAEPGARLYRSGDLAQYSVSGELEYLGRMDHQVKIRGFRVELGEIESALNRHPAIRESVVLAQDTSDGGKRLVAYIVPANPPVEGNRAEGRQESASRQMPTVTELRETLAAKLPGYMIPAFFVTLKALPLTNNGKVDRRALPAPDGARPELKHPYVAPATSAETALAKIWCEVLGIEPVGINDNFFELGGDSIRSITILSRAQKLGWNLTLHDIFQHPTVAGLAACGESGGKRIEAEPSPPFSLISTADRAKLPPDVEDAYPLAKLQMGMFFRNELDPISAIYHDVFSFRIQSAFEAEKLAEAIRRLAERHPILRTSFHLAGFSEPLQLVHRPGAPVTPVLLPAGSSLPVDALKSTGAPVFTIEELQGLDISGQDQKLVDWVEAEKRRPFERTQAPLVRFHAQLRSQECFQFIISFHHSCLDGWSLAAVITEIFQDYTALLHGREQSIAAPKIAYRDFVALERQAFTGEECRRFWSEKTKDTPTALFPRWPKACCAGGHEQVRGPEIQIESKLLEGLKRLAQTAGVPLKTVLLAAHERVMALLYGHTDVTSGLISNGRPEEVDGEKVIGLFLNALPFRLKLEGGTWLDLVKATFASEQEIIPYRRMPLAEIQKLNGGRALFETAFDFVHFHVYKHLQGRQELDFREGHYFEANDMTTYTTFMLDVTSTQLELHVDYDPRSLCRQQIEQMCAYYVNTLQAMATEPEARYDAFCPLSDSERSQILLEWNATREEYPEKKCIHELFEARAGETPEAIALVFENERVTYRELDRRANLLAAKLRKLRVGPNVLVGICLERSVEMMVGLLGILKAGGAYLPLDPAFPRERLAFMLDDAKAPVLLTQKALLETLPPTTAQILCVDASATEGSNAEFREPEAVSPGRREHETRTNSCNLAYVIYTSGSTGKPKGVQVEHRAVVNLLASAGRRANITSKDRLLAVTTLSFDIAGLELFLPLITGGQLIVAGRDKISDGIQLAALLASSGATIMQATPATWRLLLESGWKGDQRLKVFCGGEALKRGLADDLLNRVQAVWNFYGPTETTIWSTAWQVAPGEPISIGRPLANTQLYILDQQLHPVPVGAVGELHIGGDGLARGYLNRPELTAEKFIALPEICRVSGAGGKPAGNEAQPVPRIYKTGDLARYRPDGRVECLGRSDHQVKIRGFRIELGEIETVLRQHAGIADALVTARDDAFGESRLVGYVLSKNGPPSAADLRDHIKAKLPLYMVPSHFVVLEQFPLTPNGKIDVRRLPAPDGGGVAARNVVAPRNDDEQGIAEIWKEVLGVNQLGIEDNFFELGGDSLSATRAYARMNKLFSSDISLRQMLDHPTIASLAGIVRASKPVDSARSRPILPRARRKG